MSDRTRKESAGRQSSRRERDLETDETARRAPEPAREPSDHGHRVRGNDDAPDFDDAERDSCIVVHRRVDKQSDS